MSMTTVYPVEEALDGRGDYLKVTSRVAEGDLVDKNVFFAYRVDRPNDLIAYLRERSPGEPVWKALWFGLESDSAYFKELFARERVMTEGRGVVPLSRAVYDGKGECLEKATLLQVDVQERWPAYLVEGAMSEGDWFAAHAFNLVKIRGQWHLLDVQNPVWVEGRMVLFAPPVEGIREDGHIVLRQTGLQREYALR